MGPRLVHPLEAATAAAAVMAPLQYLQPCAGRLRTYAFDPPGGGPRFNGRLQARSVAIHDARPWIGERLEDSGFARRAHRSALLDFWDEVALQRVHYPEAEALVRELTGVRRTIAFDHTLRRRAAHRPPLDGMGGSFAAVREPVGRVHLDYTPWSAPRRVRDVLAARGQAARGEAFVIVGLWRALHDEPLLDAPLALADARSVAAADLVPNDLLYAQRRGQTYAVLHNPAHAWCYVPGLTRDEVLAFVHYDSRTGRDGVSRGVPHTAFEHPGTPPDARPRESLELRVLALLE